MYTIDLINRGSHRAHGKNILFYLTEGVGALLGGSTLKPIRFDT